MKHIASVVRRGGAPTGAWDRPHCRTSAGGVPLRGSPVVLTDEESQSVAARKDPKTAPNRPLSRSVVELLAVSLLVKFL